MPDGSQHLPQGQVPVRLRYAQRMASGRDGPRRHQERLLSLGVQRGDLPHKTGHKVQIETPAAASEQAGAHLDHDAIIGRTAPCDGSLRWHGLVR